MYQIFLRSTILLHNIVDSFGQEFNSEIIIMGVNFPKYTKIVPWKLLKIFDSIIHILLLTLLRNVLRFEAKILAKNILYKNNNNGQLVIQNIQKILQCKKVLGRHYRYIFNAKFGQTCLRIWNQFFPENCFWAISCKFYPMNFSGFIFYRVKIPDKLFIMTLSLSFFLFVVLWQHLLLQKFLVFFMKILITYINIVKKYFYLNVVN